MLEPRVAKEVEEVAEDIREQLMIKESVEFVLTGLDGEVKDHRVVEDG